jgi:exo-beta-1,3-glucanase (GH17 family)
MDYFRKLMLPPGRGICYSGFRKDQQPGGLYPSYEEVKEDLKILHGHWKYLRLFDCDEHAELVIKVIQQEKLDFKLMLGAYIVAEMNNFNCPWNAGVYSEEKLESNREYNQNRINKLIELANSYPDVIFSVSTGNEACVEWTDHYVPESRVLEFVNQIKSEIEQPVTFCENYVPWLVKLGKLANVVDFISIHTYPVWEYRHIKESLSYTKDNYYSVVNKHSDKQVVITEAGWATNSNGRGINPENVNEEYQKIYFDQLMEWTEKEKIMCFFFEAFDEFWKGSPEPLEPEKHWGLFKIDRTPKKAVCDLIINPKA